MIIRVKIIKIIKIVPIKNLQSTPLINQGGGEEIDNNVSVFFFQFYQGGQIFDEQARQEVHYHQDQDQYQEMLHHSSWLGNAEGYWPIQYNNKMSRHLFICSLSPKLYDTGLPYRIS